jgi:hypothetical protein
LNYSFILILILFI